MKQEDMMIVAAAAGIGWLLGRWTAPDAPIVNIDSGGMLGDAGLPQLPPPPPPPPSEPLGDGEPGTFSDRWEGLAFDVEVYPQGADWTRISPPSGPGHVSSADDCSIIALAKGWWDRAGTIAEAGVAEGMTDRNRVARLVIARILPDCAGEQTDAVMQLRFELDRRLMDMLPDLAFPPPPLPPPLELQRNPARPPPIRHELVHGGGTAPPRRPYYRSRTRGRTRTMRR